LKVERGELEETTARTYRDQIRDNLAPRLGHRKIDKLRGLEITWMYQEIMRERAEQIAAVQTTNAGYAKKAERENAARRLAGANAWSSPSTCRSLGRCHPRPSHGSTRSCPGR
jgi:hypothetical protein